MSTKRKLADTLAKPVVKPSAKAPSSTRIDEQRTAVSSSVAAPLVALGPGSSQLDAIEITSDPIEILSDSSSDGSDDEEEDGNGTAGAEDHQVEEPLQQNQEGQQLLYSAKTTALRLDGSGDAEMQSPDQDNTPPTFGELARGSTSTIDVIAALAAAANTSSSNDLQTATTGNTSATLLQGPMPRTIHGASSQHHQLHHHHQQQQQQQQQHQQSRSAASAVVTTHSLGTVLNQALRTDDTALLESCLQIADVIAVQQTVRRMESSLALQLLAKLAAFMHQKPGRASSLVRWVQCTLVAHGGALVAQPDVAARLEALHGVLAERANGLPSLLKLKGKLDMMVAQMRFRNVARSAFANGAVDGDGEDGHAGGPGSAMAADVQGDEEISAVVDRPAVVYVEGEEQDQGSGVGRMTKRPRGAKDVWPEEADEFPTAANGVFDGDSDEEDEDESNDDTDLEILADQSSADEDKVDHDDVDEDDEDDGTDNDEGAEERGNNYGGGKMDQGQDEAMSAPPAKMQRLGSGTAKRR